MTIAATGTALDERPRWRLWLAVSLGGLLVLRIVALLLNRTDLFFDEAQYWTWSLEPAFGYYSKPPLIAWLIGLSTAVCGAGEACIRLPSPILHTITAVAVYGLGARLYGPRTGFLSALAFATLPGISLSAGIISTDVPLLTCWAVALHGFAELLEEKRAWGPAILLGVAFGLGLNAKYAMAFFVPCAAIYLWLSPERRTALQDRRLWAALGLGGMMIVPNLAWNASNRFATFSHTADNAKWSGSLVHLDKGFEFFASQFGVFGPLFFAGLLVILWRWWRRGLVDHDRLMLAFSVPLIATILVQAFISRAHANWAAPAYVSATVLVVATLVREAEAGGEGWRWLKASFWLHGLVLALLVLAVATAGVLKAPAGADPFTRTLGWKQVAEATRAKLDAAQAAGHPFGAVITDERALTAELLYYMRGVSTPVLAWTGGERPTDHYEMKRPFTSDSPEPVLLVALRRDSEKIVARFGASKKLGEADLPAGTQTRRVAFWHLSRFKGF